MKHASSSFLEAVRIKVLRKDYLRNGTSITSFLIFAVGSSIAFGDIYVYFF